MNCRKTFPRIALPTAADKEVARITQIWQKRRAAFGAEGDWLFGSISIADAMYAPVALRLVRYSIPLPESETDANVKSVE